MTSSDRCIYKYDRHITVVLTNAKIKCTKCEQWKPASEFGMRHEHFNRSTTIRNQSQCSDCRSEDD